MMIYLTKNVGAIGVTERLVQSVQHLCAACSTESDDSQLAHLFKLKQPPQSTGTSQGNSRKVQPASQMYQKEQNLVHTSSLVSDLLIKFKARKASCVQPISFMDLELSTARTTWYFRVSGTDRLIHILSLRYWDAM